MQIYHLCLSILEDFVESSEFHYPRSASCLKMEFSLVGRNTPDRLQEKMPILLICMKNLNEKSKRKRSAKRSFVSVVIEG